MLGMHGTVYANYAVNEADLLLAFGVRFDDRVTGKVSEFAKHGKIVHIDIDPSEINKNKVAARADRRRRRPRPARTCSRCSTRTPTPTCRAAAATPTGCGRSTTGATTSRCSYADRDDAILPQYAIERLWQILTRPRPARRARSSRPASASIRCGRPSTSTSTSRGTGSPAAASARWASACPSAMGAQAAHPDKPVIDIDGDGSFLMNIQELATRLHREAAGQGAAAQQPAPGHGDAVGRPLLRAATAATPTSAPATTNAPYPDFVTHRQGLRRAAPTHRRDKDDLDAALEEMLDSKGPYVLDVHGAVPGARAADDPERHDGAGHHQGVIRLAATR